MDRDLPSSQPSPAHHRSLVCIIFRIRLCRSTRRLVGRSSTLVVLYTFSVLVPQPIIEAFDY
ncbi:hypothetical protein BDZ89DRAFT_1067700, partial [Hymenopellis radicata]